MNKMDANQKVEASVKYGVLINETSLIAHKKIVNHNIAIGETEFIRIPLTRVINPSSSG